MVEKKASDKKKKAEAKAAVSLWGESELKRAAREEWGTLEGQESVMAMGAYFHGYIPRNVATELLEKEGDFLVMEELAEHIPITVVAVRASPTSVLFYRLRLSLDGRVASELANSFDSTSELVRHYWAEKSSLTGSGAPLRFAVPVQAWQVSTACLLVDGNYRKLGAGSFGQVARMTFARAPPGAAADAAIDKVPVAVKDCFSSAARDREAFFKEGRR